MSESSKRIDYMLEARKALKMLEGTELAAVLSLAADDANEAALELGSAWQTGAAGKPWSKTATALNYASKRISDAFNAR